MGCFFIRDWCKNQVEFGIVYLMAKVTSKNVLMFGAELFSWKGHEGVSEVSTFTRGSITKILKRVWEDSCDVGFKLKSPKTGVEVLFIFEKVIYSNPENINESDVAWKFTEYSTKANSNPLTVIIFND